MADLNPALVECDPCFYVFKRRNHARKANQTLIHPEVPRPDILVVIFRAAILNCSRNQSVLHGLQNRRITYPRMQNLF